MKKEILKLTGLTEAEFYKMYPTPDAFASAYPGYKKKLGGLTEAFPQIATADNFFSYGVPVPPTYYMAGGPVYPQIQTEAQFFSPVYSNTNNAYAVGGSYMEVHPEAKKYPEGPVGGSAFYMMQDGGSSMPEPSKDQTFYTQKMNDFFDKLRQASYKNMMAGVMNTEEDTTAGMPQLSVGRYGGMPSFQPGGGVPSNMIYDTFDYEQVAGSASGTGLDAYKIPRQSQKDMFYGKIPNPDGDIIDYSQRYGFDMGNELKDYPGLMQHAVDSTFNTKQDPRYLMLIAAGAISPNFSDRFDVDKSSVNLDKLWNANKDLVFQQYKDDPEAFTGAVGDYRKMMYQNTDKKGFDQQKFDNLKTSKQKSDYLSSLQVNDAFTKSWNPRVDKMTANALKRMINPQAAATQSTPTASPAAAAPAASAPAAAAATTNQPAAAASGQPAATTTTTNTTTNPNYQTVTTADGQTFIVGPNNQLYSPFTGNQAAANTNQQQQRVNPYPYMDRNGYYVGTGLDNVANWLIPNNQRERYRNIREQQGIGISDLTPQQLKAIQEGTANVAEITYDTRRALFPRNRLKSLNIKFNTPGQNGAATNTQTNAPMLMPGQKGYDPTTTNQQTTSTATTNPASTTTTTNPTATSTTNPATTAATSPASTTSSQQDVNATVAKMQADARAKGMPNASFEGDYSDEDLLPADERAAIQNQQNAVDAEFQNYENYKKYRAIQERAGMTPDEYNYNQVYDYGTKQAVSPTATAKPATSSAASTTPAMTSTKKSSAKINSTDDAATRQKKKGYNNPNTYINQDYINSVRNQARGANGLPPVNVQAPADTIDTTTWPGVYAAPGTPKYDGSENLPFRMGGPYVLPMYQGLVGPSTTGTTTTGFQAPWQRTLDLINEDNYKLNAEGKSEYVGPDEFEVGLDFGKTKKKGVNPYLPAMIRGAADYLNNSSDIAYADQYRQKMSRADQVFDTFDQDRGDYRINMGDFRPDQLVPSAQQGGPMMYDIADLFFLTPYMLKNTRGRG